MALHYLELLELPVAIDPNKERDTRSITSSDCHFLKVVRLLVHELKAGVGVGHRAELIYRHVAKHFSKVRTRIGACSVSISVAYFPSGSVG